MFSREDPPDRSRGAVPLSKWGSPQKSCRHSCTAPLRAITSFSGDAVTGDSPKRPPRFFRSLLESSVRPWFGPVTSHAERVPESWRSMRTNPFFRLPLPECIGFPHIRGYRGSSGRAVSLDGYFRVYCHDIDSVIAANMTPRGILSKRRTEQPTRNRQSPQVPPGYRMPWLHSNAMTLRDASVD